jgi:hypothetical protein
MRTSLPVLLAVALGTELVWAQSVDSPVELGSRPALLVADLREGELKSRLQACLAEPPQRSAFST